MKVLQLSVHFSPNIGGVETHLLDLITGLSNRNIDVTVIAYQPLVTKTSWEMHERNKKIEIFRIPWVRGFFYKLVSHPILEFLYLLPGLFLVTPFIIFLKRINIIHAHGLIAGFVAVLWGKIFRKRIIISLHNIYHFPKGGFYLNFVRWIFNNSDWVLGLSSQSVEEIKKLELKHKNISQFTYWINLKIFKKIASAKKQLGWEKKFVVLFAGRLIPEKGIRELLEACKQFDKNIFLAIAGVGPLEIEIKNQKSKIKNMIFLGKINNDELPFYYSAADILIVPSTHEEGFGRVILESLACSTPVVAANRGAIPEAIDETVGMLIAITPDNIVKSVKQLYSYPDKRNKMVSFARTFAENRYSEKNIDVIIKSYADK